MKAMMNRRDFTKVGLAALGAASLPAFAAAHKPKLKIGCTCITWGTFPPKPGKPDETLEPALKDIYTEGFWGFETFPEDLDDWSARGALQPLMKRYPVPLKSGYITANVIDPAQRKSEIDRLVRLTKTVKNLGGTFMVMATNGVKRDSYNFQEHQANIVASLNDYAKAVNDTGLKTGLHQHTGTAIETRDEVYAVMHAVDTNHMKFAPDVGQLQKGGADAAQVVKDFLPLVSHMHLKDYKGWQYYSGYCPLGMGQVDVRGILDMVESAHQNPDIMVELDPSADGPMTPLQTLQTSKAYLQKLGYKFRT